MGITHVIIIRLTVRSTAVRGRPRGPVTLVMWIVMAIAWVWRVSRRWLVVTMRHLLRLILWHPLLCLVCLFWPLHWHWWESTILVALHHSRERLAWHAHAGSTSIHAMSIGVPHEHWRRHHTTILSLHKSTQQAHVVLLVLAHHLDLLLIHPLVLLEHAVE